MSTQFDPTHRSEAHSPLQPRSAPAQNPLVNKANRQSVTIFGSEGLANLARPADSVTGTASHVLVPTGADARANGTAPPVIHQVGAQIAERMGGGGGHYNPIPENSRASYQPIPAQSAATYQARPSQNQQITNMLKHTSESIVATIKEKNLTKCKELLNDVYDVLIHSKEGKNHEAFVVFLDTTSRYVNAAIVDKKQDSFLKEVHDSLSKLYTAASKHLVLDQVPGGDTISPKESPVAIFIESKLNEHVEDSRNKNFLGVKLPAAEKFHESNYSKCDSALKQQNKLTDTQEEKLLSYKEYLVPKREFRKSRGEFPKTFAEAQFNHNEIAKIDGIIKKINTKLELPSEAPVEAPAQEPAPPPALSSLAPAQKINPFARPSRAPAVSVEESHYRKMTKGQEPERQYAGAGEVRSRHQEEASYVPIPPEGITDSYVSLPIENTAQYVSIPEGIIQASHELGQPPFNLLSGP